MGTAFETHKTRHAIRIILRFAEFLVAALLVIASGVAGWLYWRARACLPQLDGTIKVSGLRSPVEVLRDGHGVPHLRAESLDDLAFAQGFVTAQDRLWQMDLSRRLGEGDLAEVFGEAMLRYDIENRTLGLREASEKAVTELDPETKELFDAYSAGVNAFIASHRDRLPIEFFILRYQPRPWTDADSLIVALNMEKSLNTTWPDDLMRERIRSEVSPELYADLFPDHSAYDHPVAEPVSAPPAPRAGANPPSPAKLDPTLTALLTTSEDSSAGLGSNNWDVDGRHTYSGKPLLANDPHLAHSVPSVWYMIQLKAPGLDVSGVSLPGLPLVIIGHNERIAWGMTNTGPDVQDLYSESFNFRDPAKYLHNGEWIDAQNRDEAIKVRGESDYRFTVKVTRHGPIVSHAGDRDLALRWTALDPGSVRFPFLKIDRAGNWNEFTDALRDFTGPTQNFVYADVDGNIGYYAAGNIPVRKEGDGTVPEPGSTDDYDWTGYIPFEDLPHAYNPPGGVIATANGRVVPDGYPYLITRKWDPPFRTARIFELLEAQNKFTVQDFLRIQTDVYSIEDVWLAKQLLDAAQSFPPRSVDAQYALTLLKGWDGEARADSGATLVCEVTRDALLARILRPKLGDGLSGYHWPMSTIFLQNVLSGQLKQWLPPGDANFNQTLIESLEDGVKQIPSLVGSPDHSAWRWGATIPLTFTHRLTLGLHFLAPLLNTGPVPQAGTRTTVKQTTPYVGPSMRMVVDFSSLEQSVQNITLGESGQVFSPYYRDQFEDWYHGQSFTMLFSDASVERGAAHRLTLEPARPE